MFDDDEFDDRDDHEWSGWNLPLPIISGFSTTIKFHYMDTRDRVTLDRVVEVAHLLGDNLDRPTHFSGKCRKRRETRTFSIWSASDARTMDGKPITDLSSYLMVEADKLWFRAKRRGPLSWKEQQGQPVFCRRSKSGEMVRPDDRTDDWWGGDLMHHALDPDPDA